MNAKSTCVPYVIDSVLTARKDHEPTVDNKQYMSDVGFFSFVADTTHPSIYHIVGVLGRHLHNPAQRHVNELKPIYRYLTTRANDGPAYDKKGPIEFTCYADSDHAACKDASKPVSVNINMSLGQLLMWGSSFHGVPIHSSTEAEYISADTGERNVTWMSILADELSIPMQKKTVTSVWYQKPN